MGRLRKAILRILDAIDPPVMAAPKAPCPSCGLDVAVMNNKSEVRNDLTYFQCRCGHASAWYWNGRGPQLIYGQEPREDAEVYEELD